MTILDSNFAGSAGGYERNHEVWTPFRVQNEQAAIVDRGAQVIGPNQTIHLRTPLRGVNAGCKHLHGGSHWSPRARCRLYGPMDPRYKRAEVLKA